MARPGLSYEIVAKAADELSQAGETPTINRIREILGNTGSPTTISRLLKEWKDKHGAHNDDPELSEEDETQETPMQRPKRTVYRASDTPSSYAKTPPPLQHAENLTTMNESDLMTKVRRLQTEVEKESSRREAAEKMAREAKEYAEVIKDEVAQRIENLKESMEATIIELKAEAKRIKDNADKDLAYYREQLEKANQKIIIMKG